jgi:GntR family transcriptional regulator
MLDRNIPAPLYEQLKAHLSAEARERANEPRAATTDAALMKRFGVSRATVRSAIAELVREGVAKRVPGVGTFLAPARRHSVGLDGFDRFFQEWNLPSLDPGTQILTFRRMRADPEVAADLHLERGALVLLVRRLRTAGGEPAT